MALNKEPLSEVVTELTQSLEIISRFFYMGEQEPDLQVAGTASPGLLAKRVFRSKSHQLPLLLCPQCP